MLRRAPAAPMPTLDDVDRRLIFLLSQDGRRTGADLAKQLGLSRQAVAERLSKLEKRGIVRGYRADIDPAVLGLPVRGQIRLTLYGGVGPKAEAEVLRRLVKNPMVRCVHRVSGEDCFVAQVVCRRIEDVNAILAELQKTKAISSSRTAFVLETIVEKGAFGPVDEGLLREPV